MLLRGRGWKSILWWVYKQKKPKMTGNTYQSNHLGSWLFTCCRYAFLQVVPDNPILLSVSWVVDNI